MPDLEHAGSHPRPAPAIALSRAQTVAVPPVPAVPSTAGAPEEAQIFVDDSGRRARRVRLAGLGLALACATWLGALGVGMSGFASFAPVVLHHVLASRPADHAGTQIDRGHARGRLVHLAARGGGPEVVSGHPLGLRPRAA